MSSHSRITDDEMKYFQFKARQCFLLQKEDHEWNEFCKQKKCTCCSCQPMNLPKQMKNIGIQASAKAPTYLNRNTYVKSFRDKELPESLNDIKTKLEKIDLTLSNIKIDAPIDNMQKSVLLDSKLVENDSTINFYTEQKKSLIRKSLMNSLQRLHSFAMQNSPRQFSSPNIAKKNRSFFIPHDLQKQRTVARKAYLASLVNHPKIEKKKETPVLNGKRKTVKKNNTVKQAHRNLHGKPSITSMKQKSSILKKKDEATLIQSEEISETKDENIEKSIDMILEDLLDEEILALNRIRHGKIGKQVINSNAEKDEEQLKNIAIKQCKNTKFDGAKGEIHLHTLSPESRYKIRQNSFFNLKIPVKRNSANSSCSEAYLEDEINPFANSYNKEKTVQNISKHTDTENSSLPNPNLAKDKSKSKNMSGSTECTVIYADPQLAERVSKHRYLYWQYLEKISRTRTNNFDPLALSNMNSANSSCSEAYLEDEINPFANSYNKEKTVQNISKYTDTENSSLPNPNLASEFHMFRCSNCI